MKRTVLLAVFVLALVPGVAVAASSPVDVDPTHVRFGNQPNNSHTTRSFTITNTSSEPVLVTIETPRVGDEFSPGQLESTCPLTSTTQLAPGESCFHVVGFDPTPVFTGHQTALMRVVVTDLAGNILDTQDVKLSGRAF